MIRCFHGFFLTPGRQLRQVLLSALFCTFVSATAETITIDFANDLGPVTYRASGFLHGMSTTVPADSMVSLLKPRLMRFRPSMAVATYTKTKALGAKSMSVLSDARYGTLPGTNNDWSGWENIVRTTVSDAIANNREFEWDIWNEPDSDQFWTGTLPQFYETWRRAVITIRSLDPDAVIVGPSITHFDYTWLQNFLQFAKANNVLPTGVAWHEIGTSATVRGISSNIKLVRSYLAAQGMNVPRIYINEMMGSDAQHNPGLMVRFMAEVEKGKVDGANKSCWNESTGSNCNNYSLNGLLTATTHMPRAGWWAYRSYADITGRLVGVKTAPTPFYVDGIAGQDATKREARVVLGRFANSGSLDVNFTNLDKVPFLGPNGMVHVTVNRIRNTGEAAMAGPSKVLDADYPVANNSLLVRIADFPDSNAMAIRLTPGSTAGILTLESAPPAPIRTRVSYSSANSVEIRFFGEDLSGPVSVILYDLAGRAVQTLHETARSSQVSFTWNTNGHHTGIYLARITAGQKRFIRQISIVH